MCDLLTDSSINKIGFQFFFSLILKKENVDGELGTKPQIVTE